MFVALLHVAISQLRRLLAACLHLARAFRDWYQRPSTSELRGLKLLREWLSQEQLAQYDAHKYFEVIGCHTGKRYRICHGTGANVFELDDAGLPRKGWCFVPNESSRRGRRHAGPKDCPGNRRAGRAGDGEQLYA